MRFTEQLQRVHPNVLAKALSRGIVHQDKELVVINKPYGLPVHGEEHVAGKGEGRCCFLLQGRVTLTLLLGLSEALLSE